MQRWITVTLIGLVALCAFTLSFNALASLAAASHLGGWLSVIYPVNVDGCALLAGWVALTCRSEKERVTRRIAFVVMATLTSLSLAANVLHSALGPVDLPIGARIVIGAAPALSLLACAELATRLLTKPAPAAKAKKATVTAADHQPMAKRSASTPPRVAASGAKDAVIAWAQERFAETGAWPSGPELGERLGQSRKSGSRLRAALVAGEL
ncbi:DUF2637 domain-containing protein [Gryllotalpicola protaetiae]|nr:DUF2637 domain-containing protein [Gryllotalpicola protaetiae]